jgi:hypothetical protein
MYRAIVVSGCILLLITTGAAELLQTIPTTGMELVLLPNSTRGDVVQTCDIAYGRGRNLVNLCYSGAKVAPDSIALQPPDGVSVIRADRPAGRADTIVWQVDGGAQTRRPTVIRYTLDGLKWRLIYRMDYSPSAGDPARGTVALSAELELTNESGMDLEGCALSLDMGSRDDGQALLVGGDTIDLPAGWTKCWAVRTRGGDPCILDGLEATVAYVYDPLRFKGAVQRLLQIAAPADEAALLAALALPEGALELYLPGDDFATELPAATSTWRPTPGAADAAKGPWVEIDTGPESSILVNDTLAEFRRDKFALDKTGRVSGSDIIENHHLRFTNYTATPVAFTAYQEVATKWALSGLTPALGESVPPDRGTAKPVWSGTLQPGVETLVRFTVTKHQGTNK